MNNLTFYKLQPQSGFHFGELGLELEESRVIFPSDSLFAAMVAVLAEQKGGQAATDFAALFDVSDGSHPFALTSTLPYVGNLPLLPLPQLPITASNEDKVPRKFSKKTRFISPEICRLLCAGAAMDDYLPLAKGQSNNGRFLQGGKVWLTQAEQAHLPNKWRTLSAANLYQKAVWQQGHVPRVTIDRRHNNSNVFLAGRVIFNQECGLWFGLQWTHGEDAKLSQQVENLLAHLGDRGIGGERSNGYGGFIPQKAIFALPQDAWTAGNGYQMLLSRYLPQKEELPALQAELAAYRLVTVGGWLASPGSPHLRRRQLSLLAEGSVVGLVINGRMADVRPESARFTHAVWRNGQAITLNVMRKKRSSGGGDE